MIISHARATLRGTHGLILRRVWEGDMKILVVGGTGLIGGHAALRLKSVGHDVEITARKPAAAGSALTELPFHRIDYVNEPADHDLLARFAAVVFAAGNDVRHIPRDGDEDTHWRRANSEAVPRVLAAAKQAGVRHAILIGSFYPQAAPHLIAKNSYIASRLAADEGARALADETFHVVVLNAPFVIGHVPGLVVPVCQAMANWALGRIPGVERFAVAGGVNVISTDTLTDAIVGALAHGRNGKAYLIGDENLTFRDYFGLFFKAAGDLDPLDVRDQEHPFLPDSAILAGRGRTIFYETLPAEVAELNYRQHDVARTIAMIVATNK
jgi:nucleoside-diphosphate-sugar epimerase